MRHPAREVDFETLYTHLMDEVQRGSVHMNRKGSLCLFHYTNKCVYDKLWNPWSLMARGLILDVENRKVIATPFPKFFNYGELGYQLPEEGFEAFEKVDGSLIVCFWYNNQWQLETKGAFDTPQAIWARERFKNFLHKEKMVPGHTYLFEAIFQSNRIVVRYPYEDLVLLTSYDDNGYEYPRSLLETYAIEFGCRICQRYSYSSLEEICDAASKLDANGEGFVVRFLDGTRSKIKGATYCRIHSLVSGVTPLGIWDSLRNGDDLEKIRKEIPEEFWSDFDALVRLITDRYNQRISLVEEWNRRLKDYTDKEVGLSRGNMPEEVVPFIFSRRKLEDNWTKDPKVRQSLFRSFRPNGNMLEGYEPSTYLLGLKDEDL